jgi:hypothetical protein
MIAPKVSTMCISWACGPSRESSYGGKYWSLRMMHALVSCFSESSGQVIAAIGQGSFSSKDGAEEAPLWISLTCLRIREPSELRRRFGEKGESLWGLHSATLWRSAGPCACLQSFVLRCGGAVCRCGSS